MDVLIDFVNFCIKGIGDTVGDLIGLLSRWCPFYALEVALDGDFLGMINWFIPISEMIAILEGWGIAIGASYVVSIILRWLKVRS